MTTPTNALQESRSLTLARLIAEQTFDRALSNVSAKLRERGYTRKDSTSVLFPETPVKEYVSKPNRKTPQENLIELSELELMRGAELYNETHKSPNGSPTVVFKLDSAFGRKFVRNNEKAAKQNKRSSREIESRTIVLKGRKFSFQAPKRENFHQQESRVQDYFSVPRTIVLMGKQTLSQARRKFVLATITKKAESGTLGRGKPIVMEFTSALDIIRSQYNTVSNPLEFTGNDLSNGAMIAESKPRKSVLERERKSLRVEIFEGKTRLTFEKSKRKLDSLSSYKLVSSVLPKLKKADFESAKIASKDSGKTHTIKHGKYTLKFYWMSH